MLSSRTIKFLTAATLIAIAVFATISMVGLPAGENALNAPQSADLAADSDSEGSVALRQPDLFDAYEHPGPGR